MNIVYCGAHSILEHDELRLFHALGHDVFSLGGYITPSAPHDPKRPALPGLPNHPELRQVVDAIGSADNLDAAKVHIPDAILEWADLLIYAAFEWRWLAPEWDRIKGKRVVWRTIGQSLETNERLMAPLFKDGLEIVRYSPKERSLPGYAGESAVIRFAKDPAEWTGWTGDMEIGAGSDDWTGDSSSPFVVNFTQHLRQRHPATNYLFWKHATAGLPAVAAGPGSEAIGGAGEQPYAEMQAQLRGARAYLFCGTQPASYTLGLIEAMLTGIPVVSIGPGHMTFPDLFEGHEIAGVWTDEPAEANRRLGALLESPYGAAAMGRQQRARAIDLFGFEGRVAEWGAFLGGAGTPADAEERQAVPV